MPPYRTNLNNPIWANNMRHYNSIKDVVIPYDNNPYRTDYTNIPEVIDGPTESAPSPLSLGIAAAETLGTTLNTLANRSIEENNPYNSNASIIGTTSWSDVLGADQRIAEGINNIQESTDDYSGYNSIDTLKNAWNPTQRQQLEGISDLQRTGNLFGDVISGGAKLASLGSALGPIGIAVGGIVGAATEGVKDLIGFSQQDKAIEEANKAIARANSDSRANFYNTSDNIAMRNNRNYWLNNIMAEGGLLNEFNVGGTHEQNPYGGVQQGIAQDGLPNLVEEGEIRSDFDASKIFNNKNTGYNFTEKDCEDYNLPKFIVGCNPAEAIKKLKKEYDNRTNDPISIATMKEWDARVFQYQEDKTAEKEAKQLTKEFNALPNEAKVAMAEDAYQQQLPLDELNAEQPVFAKGGKIYIKPKNRGKFTALKKRTGKSASWFKAHGTPAQKKMATFALNAKKWSHKHDEGGHLFPLGGYPFGALGAGTEWLDLYNKALNKPVPFADRDTMAEAMLQNYATVGNMLGKPIIGLDTRINNGNVEQDVTYDDGTKETLTGRRTVPTTKYFNNPYYDKDVLKFGVQNLVDLAKNKYPEQGFLSLASKYLTNETQAPYIDAVDPIGIATEAAGNPTTQDVARDYWNKLNGFVPEEPVYISDAELNDILNNKNKPNDKSTTTSSTDTDNKKKIKFNFNTEDLRYSPAVGAGLGSLVAALQPRDYSLANRYEELAGQYKPIAAPHIGGYRRYTPYDINLGDVENLALTSRAISANRGQNRATQGALNTAVIAKAQETEAKRNLIAQQANEANRAVIDQYNLGIDQFNAQRDSQYDQLNQQILANKINMLGQAAQARDASDAAWAQMYNTTHENFFNQLGNVGRDEWNRNQRNILLNEYGPEILKLFLKS